MVFLLSVCGPPAPRIEEPFDGEEDTGNRCSQQFILDPFYPAGLALILRTPTESGRKSPVFWYGVPRGWAVRRHRQAMRPEGGQNTAPLLLPMAAEPLRGRRPSSPLPCGPSRRPSELGRRGARSRGNSRGRISA